ncbi:butyrophilin-like protein 2 isoform X2 [Anguilla rostrata]
MQTGLNLLSNVTISVFSTMIVLQILPVLWLVQLVKSQASSVPGDKVIATLGQPVLLNCHPEKPFKPNRIFWQGRKPSDPVDEYPWVLHAYNNGAEELHTQNISYRNRTSIYMDLIPQGNLSLLISEAKVEDDNTQIFVHVQADIVHNICRKDLRVAAMPQKPEVNVSCMEGAGEQQIVCTSHGSFPEPTLNWTGLNQRESSPLPTVTFNPNENTYSIRSALWVNLTKDQRVTCYVTNPTLQETINTSITPRDSCSSMYPTNHLHIWMAVLAIVIVCAGAILYYKRKVLCSCPKECSGEDPGPTSDHPAKEACLLEMKDRACCDT